MTNFSLVCADLGFKLSFLFKKSAKNEFHRQTKSITSPIIKVRIQTAVAKGKSVYPRKCAQGL